MSVKVAVRARPVSARERTEGAPIVVRMNGNEVEVANANDGTKGRAFLYDEALWSAGVRVEGSTNEEATQGFVYNVVGAAMLEHALMGYNGCIFAYGQTGSGKTHTMMGPEDDPGIIPRLAESLFAEVEHLREAESEVCVEVSFYEVYCEKVRCLLRPTEGGFRGSALRVREHPTYGPFVEGLAKFVVSSQCEFLRLMKDGHKVRRTASTAMNATSSRSHAVFAVTLTQRKRKGKLITTTTSRLNLVDLAGSERAGKTMTTGQRFAEGTNINQSLACLGNVISALAEAEEKGKARHIPYRDSVLTWILKDNLGGNSKTAMIATISPSAAQYEETMSTLRYAERAKKIVNTAFVNESINDEVIAALEKEIAALKLQLTSASAAERARLREVLAASEAVQKELSTSLEEKLAETRRMMEERERYMKELERKLDTQAKEIGTLKRANEAKEQRITDLLRRIDALSQVRAAAAHEDGQGDSDIAGGGGAAPTSSPMGTEQTILEQMRGEVAALEQERNAAETRIKGKRQTVSPVDADDDMSILMEATPACSDDGLGVSHTTAGVTAENAAQALPLLLAVQKPTCIDVGTVSEGGAPLALKPGLHPLHSSATQPHDASDADDLFGSGPSSPADYDEATRGANEDHSLATQDTGPPPADDDLEVDSDLTLDADDDEGVELEADAGIELDEGDLDPVDDPVDYPPPEPSSADHRSWAAAVSGADSFTYAALPQQQAMPRKAHVDPLWEVALGAAQQEHPLDSAGQQPPKLHPPRQQPHGYGGAAPALPLRVGSFPHCGEGYPPQPCSPQSAQPAAVSQTSAKPTPRPEIFAPAQRLAERVVPSHALPNNHYLREPFKVIKVNDSAFAGQRKARIWVVDLLAHTFSNCDTKGCKSFDLSSSNLLGVERDPGNAKRLTLYFLAAPHPYGLEFTSASRRRCFYELAMLQRRHTILWCPSLCLGQENDVAVTVRGTTVQQRRRVMRVSGEAVFNVARMPYEVIRLWHGGFSLEKGLGLPRNAAVLASFMPKEEHDVYVLGIADVPSSLLGNDDIGLYFTAYLGAEEYYTVGTTTTENPTHRGTHNAMLLFCRRSFAARISHVQLAEAPSALRKDVSRDDFAGVGCAFHINEVTLCAILVNAKGTASCGTPTRNACIRALLTGFPFGDTSVDVASRFDYLMVSGSFGFSSSSGGTPFTAEDPLTRQIRLNNVMSSFVEGEPSEALRMLQDPMRVLFAVRPRVSRMDVDLYSTSRAFPMTNVFLTADVFSQRAYLSVFGEAVPRTQLIVDHLEVMGDRLPDLASAQIQIRGEFFEGAPLVAPVTKQGPRHYTTATTAVPILCPTVSHNEFLRLQTLHFSLVGSLRPSRHGRASTLASGALPLKGLVAMGETKGFAVPLYYRSCLVGVLQGHLLAILYEENVAEEAAAAGLSCERFVTFVRFYENQVWQRERWVHPRSTPTLCAFSGKDPSEGRSMESFELPDPLTWRWLTEWQHDRRTDDEEGWVYSAGGHAPLELTEGKHSMVRRRRWMRAMQAQDAITLHNYLSLKHAQAQETPTE